MRLDAFKLGCRILRDPNEVLQKATCQCGRRMLLAGGTPFRHAAAGIQDAHQRRNAFAEGALSNAMSGARLGGGGGGGGCLAESEAPWTWRLLAFSSASSRTYTSVLDSGSRLR